jgi:predicted nuclease of predicted toxin-antitoxin system
LRILFDMNVPIGVRHFLVNHEVRTVVEMGWPSQLENGEPLNAAEAAAFDVIVTSDQNIRHQQNLAGRKLALGVLGSNIWPIVRKHAKAIATTVDAATPGSYDFIEMPLPPKSPHGPTVR